MLSGRTHRQLALVPPFSAPLLPLAVEGRTHSVQVHYREAPASDYLTAAVETAVAIHREDQPGDILIFMTGQDECETGERRQEGALPPLGAANGRSLRTLCARLTMVHLHCCRPVIQKSSCIDASSRSPRYDFDCFRHLVRDAVSLRLLCCPTSALVHTLHPARPAVVRQLEDEGRRLQRSRLKLKLKPAALYAGLPAAHQLGVFEPAPRGVRKVWKTGRRRDGGDTASQLGGDTAGWGGLPGKACPGMLRNRHALPPRRLACSRCAVLSAAWLPLPLLQRRRIAAGVGHSSTSFQAALPCIALSHCR